MNLNWKKALVYLVGALATALGILFGMSSCAATRTYSVTSSCVQKADSVMIQSTTIERYVGKKKVN